MTLPPERISIKRRRQDEPVDALFLDQGISTPDKKRRYTDYFFKRLRNDKPSERSVVIIKTPAQNEDDAVLQQRRQLGLPVVRATKPGDEYKDYAKVKAAQQNANREIESAQNFSEKAVHSSDNTLLHKIKSARRFHLTRNLSGALRPDSSGGIRRRKLELRPPLATFIERQAPRHDSNPPSSASRLPVDSIVHFDTEDSATVADGSSNFLEAKTARKVPLKTFHKTEAVTIRQGQSIHDDPSTWDFESDDLADQLAALALEFDPDIAAESTPPQPVDQTFPDVENHEAQQGASQEVTMLDHNNQDDYVFETYIRVKHDENADLASTYIGGDVGVLVIDEEDNDLWNRYVNEDDDDDFDDEDEDSNAEEHPRNDYPEDEVSSDDERGMSTYRYRRDDSDDAEE